MHVVNELEADVVTIDDQEYEEVVEVIEEVLAAEEVPEPPTNFVDSVPTQGKPRCITPILLITWYIYVCITFQELI
jgi:hypothetical protein